MKTILSILNPVHLPTVAEWMEIANIASKVPEGFKDTFIEVEVLKLQSRFEELTRGKWVERVVAYEATSNPIKETKWQPALLKKEMFVCEVEPVISVEEGIKGFEPGKYFKMDSYTKAQEKVWFEGVEFTPLGYVVRTAPTFHLFTLGKSTIHDFIIECERAKAEVNWTENFVKALLR